LAALRSTTLGIESVLSIFLAKLLLKTIAKTVNCRFESCQCGTEIAWDRSEHGFVRSGADPVVEMPEVFFIGYGCLPRIDGQGDARQPAIYVLSEEMLRLADGDEGEAAIFGIPAHERRHSTLAKHSEALP
jgi:hypothetical protein